MASAKSQIYRAALITLCVTGAYQKAEAQTYTDALSQINQKLQELGPMSVTIPYEQEIEYEECSSHPTESGSDCPIKFKRKKKVIRQRVEQTTLRVESLSSSFTNEPTLKPASYTDFPRDLIESSMVYKNCTNSQGNTSVSLTLNATRSKAVAISRSIKNSVGGSFSVKAKVFTVEGSATVILSQDVTNSTVQTDTRGDSYTISASASIVLPPKTSILSILRSYKIQAKVPFTIVGTLDGPVNMNDKGYRTVSGAIPAEADRSFTVEGELIANDFSKGYLEFFNVENECRSDDRSVSAQAFIPRQGQVVRGTNRYRTVKTIIKEQ